MIWCLKKTNIRNKKLATRLLRFYLLAILSIFFFFGDLNIDIMTKAETEREKQRLRELLGSNKALEESDFYESLLSLIGLVP